MHLFISYSKADSKAIAVHLRDRLRAANADITVWMDEALVPGDGWAEQIEREIDRCDHMIVLISRDVRRPRTEGQDYSFVRKEIAYARESGKNIIPVMVEPTRLPIEITDLEYIDFTKNREQGIEALLAFIFTPAAVKPTGERASADSVSSYTVKRAAIRWGEAPDVTDFLGRENDQETLLGWIRDERCRVAAILGMGGLGKSALAAKLVEQLQGDFDTIFWASLRNAPKLNEIYADLIRFLSPTDSASASEASGVDLNTVLRLLRRTRCLIVLDNFETVFLAHQGRTGGYLEGYEDYGDFIRTLGDSNHNSCVLITSREKPKEIAAHNTAVRAWNLAGLDETDSVQMLEGYPLIGTDGAKVTLVDKYAGNPLALKLVATAIEETFEGSVDAFLAQGTFIFDDIQDILEQQVERVSALELDILHWLALYREPRPLADLENDVIPRAARDDLLNALKSLIRRSLIEPVGGGFTLQNVVMEFLTGRFITQVCEALVQLITLAESAVSADSVRLSRESVLNKYPFIQATAKDYLRDSQKRLILGVILDKLGYIYDGAAVVRDHFSTHLKHAAGHLGKSAGYANGNIINALSHMDFDFTDAAFSNITLWQAFLRDVELHGVDFSGSDIARTVFTETISSIFAIALNAGGELLAMGGYAGDIHLWRSADKTKLRTFEGHKRPVWSLAFGPDDRILASSGDDHTIKLWDVETGACIHTLEGHASWVRAIAFHPDGHLLASAGGDHSVRLWDVQTGACLNLLEGHTGGVRAVAFHPAGGTLASAGADSMLRLWDVGSGECVSVTNAHEGFVFSLKYSPDGKILASTGADRHVNLWDATDRLNCTRLHRLNGHNNEVHTVAFSADSKLLASGGQDKIIKVWHMRSKAEVVPFASLTGHTSWVWSLAFSPSGLPKADSEAEVPNYMEETGYTLVSGSADQTVKIWEIKGANDSKCIATWKGRTDWVRSVVYTPDGERLVSGSADHLVRVWDLTRSQPVLTLDKHDDQVHSVAVSPDGRTVASAGWDGVIHLWDIQAGRHLHSLTEHASTPWSVAFSPDGKLLASGGNDSAVKLWDVATGQCLATFTDHTAQVYGVAFSPDGKVLASGGFDSKIKLWQVAARRGVGTLRARERDALVTCVAFSPDGRYLAAGNRSNTIDLWDIQAPAHITTLEGHTGWIYGLAFDPGGSQYMASGSGDNTIRLWDVNTRSTRRVLKGHRSWVHSVAFSPDGKVLASGSRDETIRLFAVATGEVVNILKAKKQYEGMNISGVTGLSDAQINTLISLGAVQN